MDDLLTFPLSKKHSHRQTFNPSRGGESGSTQDFKKRAVENTACCHSKHEALKRQALGMWWAHT